MGLSLFCAAVTEYLTLDCLQRTEIYSHIAESQESKNKATKDLYVNVLFLKWQHKHCVL